MLAGFSPVLNFLSVLMIHKKQLAGKFYFTATCSEKRTDTKIFFFVGTNNWIVLKLLAIWCSVKYLFAPYSRYSTYHWQKDKKKGKKDTDNWKTLCVWRKLKKQPNQTAKDVISDEAELRAKKNYFRSNVKLSIISWYYIMILCWVSQSNKVFKDWHVNLMKKIYPIIQGNSLVVLLYKILDDEQLHSND